MKYEKITTSITNRSGLKLAAEIYKPEGIHTMPMVMILHGFTGYKEENNLVDIAQNLAAEGIASIRFTTAGFGDSEGVLEKEYRFSTYRNDLEDVYAYIQTLPYVDTKHVGVCGHSMGGKLAFLFCADHPEITAVCVISAPMHFMSTSFGEKKEAWEKVGYFEKISGRDGHSIRIPYSYVEDESKSIHNVLPAIESITHPHALVIAGKEDSTVPWQDTKRMFDALECPKEFLLLDGVDHWYKKTAMLLPRVHQPITVFFHKFL